MLWYVVTFFAGCVCGVVVGVFALALLSNSKIDETEPNDDSVLNPDGTPKRITFKDTDL
jgi:hypothetical protein